MRRVATDRQAVRTPRLCGAASSPQGGGGGSVQEAGCARRVRHWGGLGQEASWVARELGQGRCCACAWAERGACAAGPRRGGMELAGLEEAGWARYLGHDATRLSREVRQVGLRGVE